MSSRNVLVFQPKAIHSSKEYNRKKKVRRAGYVIMTAGLAGNVDMNIHVH